MAQTGPGPWNGFVELLSPVKAEAAGLSLALTNQHWGSYSDIIQEPPV